MRRPPPTPPRFPYTTLFRSVCREHGMRLVGPNCLGVLNTAADARLDATFIPRQPPPGNVGFVSQSGALGLALAEFAHERRLGDRKSTRLNSSHMSISYAVFC